MCWFAAYTKPRSEFKALDYFTKCGVNAYVPEYIKHIKWSDRVKKTRTTAISGYVFFEMTEMNYPLLNMNPFTRNVVKSLGELVTIKSDEILMLKNALKGYTTKRDFQYGDSVKIGNGPFENKKGEVEEVNDTHITILLNSIKVKLSLSNSKLSLAR